jgi:hypothetical protein
MSANDPEHLLGRLKLRYKALRLAEIGFLAGGAVLLTLALSTLFSPVSGVSVAGSIVAGVAVFAIRFKCYHLGSLTNVMLTGYLNRTYPQLRQSADLLMMNDNSLTSVARLQKRLIIEEFNKLYPQIKVPQQVPQAFGIFTSCVVAYVVLSSFLSSNLGGKRTPELKNATTTQSVTDTVSATLKGIQTRIDPPAYTGVKPATGAHDVNAPEGSTVTWQIQFSKEIENAKIIFSGRDSIALTRQSAGVYSIKKNLTESGFYQVQWKEKSKSHTTDYYKIELVPDEPPKVSIDNLNQFTKLTLHDDLSVQVTSTLADDYGLKDADIVATVSKGSGESVKFREEKLRFITPEKISGKGVHARTVLDLKKLGLEPGDEIYFYVEAFDNKSPLANRNRTETFFIALQDTTSEIVATDDGLGVDLMPEYFRSQRQIIIDTEKLLRDRKKMSKHDFNSTSNELGYDEKVLRLKYGQFMGEEAESGIALAVNPQEEDDGDDEDPAKKYGHAHDTKNEHNLLEEKKENQPGRPDSHRDHDGIVKDPNAKEDPLEAFIHKHDDSEEATFFIQSVKAKLKAALSIMWDAELHLRLYDPAKSLPYQYKVLNLLKEISNDSRIYVHRTGFDPAPLKEERRLTADLSEIRNFTDRNTTSDLTQFRHIRTALAVTEQMIAAHDFHLTEARREIFKLAGQELAALTIEQPVTHLKGLSLLKILFEQNLSADEMPMALKAVRSSLWKALPNGNIAPAAQPAQPHKLDEAFIRQLEATKNE